MNPKLKKALLPSSPGPCCRGLWRAEFHEPRPEPVGSHRREPLENAPPMLAFTTVALGGFRGLISNILWIRAAELQENDKFFEMAQLAD